MNQNTFSSQEFHINPRRSRHLEMLLLLSPILMLTGLAIMFYNFDLHKLLFTDKIGKIELLWLVFLGSLFPLSWFIHWRTNRRLARLGRVVVSEKGLYVDQAMPSWLGGKFSLDWHEISKVNIIERFGVVQFYRPNSPRPLSLRLTDWIPVEQSEGPAVADLRATPLWASLEAAGAFRTLSDEENTATAVVNFDLAKHPATQFLLLVMGLLTVGLFADNLLTSEAWAEWRLRYLLPHILVGGLIGIVVSGWLNQIKDPKKIPSTVILFLGLLMTMIGGISSWLGGIHLNQWLGEPLEAHAYTRNAQCDTLLPKEADLPPIEYTHQAKDYWCQFPQEQEHAVLIRRGLGGLYTVDLAPHTKAIREFRAQQKNSAKQ